MKHSTSITRRLSAAVLAGSIAFTGLGLASPAFAAPVAEAAGFEAGDYVEVLTANVVSDSGTGYGVEEILYSIDAYPGDEYILSGDGISHMGPDNSNHTRAYTFLVKLTSQPRVITHLIAKHKDSLAGADKLIKLENPLIVPAYQPWPPSVLTDEIIMPSIKMGIDAQGYTTFAYDASEIGTTSPDLERENAHLTAWVNGERVYGLAGGEAYRCDEPGSLFNGAKVELRAMYTSKIDGTARHNSVFVDCPASIPLGLKLSQETTSVKHGETVAFTIDEVAGTYGKNPVISWSVDGRTVEGATGQSFQAPDTGFTAIQASVTIEDRAGEQLTRTVGWANPSPGNSGGTVEPDTDTEPGTPDTTKPDTDQPGVSPDTDDKPGQPDSGVDTDGKPDTGKPGTKPDADDKPGTKPDADDKPGTKPDADDKPGKPDNGIEVDRDDDDSPYKAECEGLCDKGYKPTAPDADQDIVDVVVSKKPLTGYKKPVLGADNPRVMSTLVR